MKSKKLPHNTIQAMCKIVAYMRILPDDAWYTIKDAAQIGGCSSNTANTILKYMARYKLLTRVKKPNDLGQNIYHFKRKQPSASL